MVGSFYCFLFNLSLSHVEKMIIKTIKKLNILKLTKLDDIYPKLIREREVITTSH